MLPTKFRFIWPSGFREEDFFKSTNQKQELAATAMFVNGSGQNEQSLQRTFHSCLLLTFDSFGQAVSEEKIFNNRPIRNKNCLWQPCLLTYGDKMSNLYRGTSIDASYQVSVHLAERFQRRRLKCEKLTDDKCKSSHCLWQGQLKMLIRKLFTRQMIINIMWMMRCIQGGECTSWKTSCAA